QLFQIGVHESSGMRSVVRAVLPGTVPGLVSLVLQQDTSAVLRGELAQPLLPILHRGDRGKRTVYAARPQAVEGADVFLVVAQLRGGLFAGPLEQSLE